MRITLFGMTPRALPYFYRQRLRKQPMQELFAAAGIAVGVALVFAVQVSNTSIVGSAEQLVHGVSGSARLQLAARTSAGFDERLAVEANRLRGVRRSAPLLRARVALQGPRGTRAIELFGGTAALGELGGNLMRNFGPRGLQLRGGLALPEGVARSLGVRSGQRVTLLSDGRRRRIAVGAVLQADTIGPIAQSRVAVGSLEYVQRLTDMPGRLSQLLVEPWPGHEAAVRRQLRRLVGGHVTVQPADAELGLLRQASEPNDRSTALFAAIGAMVGFLFAVTAMLVTGAERRRFIADLRIQGFAPRQVVVLLVFEAMVLGLSASLVGLLLGDVLSRAVFDDVPEYLTFAFPVGSQRVVEASTVALALGLGLLAALSASLRPLLDLRRRRPLDAVFHDLGEPGEAISPRDDRIMMLAGVAIVVAVTALVSIVPGATIVGVIGLAVAAVLLMPAMFVRAARVVDRATCRSRHLNLVGLAMRELQGTKTRSMALAAVGGLAVFGSVTIAGAHSDLLRGLDRHFVEHVATADLWVTNVGDTLTTGSFNLGDRERAIAHAPGVAAVRIYRGALLDLGDRRVYVSARPRGDRMMVPPSQMVDGDVTRATALLRGHGWAAVSAELAQRLGLKPGQRISLPGAGGLVHFRIAALTTNLGWPPGTVTINASDFARGWRVRDPTALEIDLKRGVTAAAGSAAVRRALGPSSGLRVQTRSERAIEYRDMERQGLSRLSQISLLLLITGTLAMASAMGAAIWERRRRLAALKIQGFNQGQLWRTLLYETGFVIAVGCLAGALMGIYGHFLAGRYLRLTTGFPAPFAFDNHALLVALAFVVGSAYVITALPGYLAARTPMSASLHV